MDAADRTTILIVDDNAGIRTFVRSNGYANVSVANRGPSSRSRRRLEEDGRSPAELILERRLERATELLRDSAGSVSEVAYAVGFKSVSHFTKRFRERFNVTPSTYSDN